MSQPKIVKSYKVGLTKLDDKDYIVITLTTDEGEEVFLLEWGFFARNLAVDIIKYNSEVSVRKRYSL
ncbi:MAG: hypothetical protein J7K82_04100 [Thermoproteales archaeon]|nr:hypothetical protein [Thermoproteales archaeon]